jgi:hypothetical protein
MKKAKPCYLCGTRTVGRVDIEVNQFRGDDEVVKACNDCQKGRLRELLEKWVEKTSFSIETK